MLEQLKQVGMTYLTWRWIWLLLPLNFALMLAPVFISRTDDAETLTFSLGAMFAIAIPIMTYMPFSIGIAKWQFADPRARLMPGYGGPHFAAIFAVLAVLLVANPLLQAFCQGISPLGLLAFSLLLGGLFLQATLFQRGIYALPMMAVYMSSFFPTSSQIWFSTAGDFHAIHGAIAFGGAAMVGWSLWRLIALSEEDEGYFIVGFGSSRLELLLKERLKGRKIARGGLKYQFSDRWHNRLTSLKSPNPAALAQYGWMQFSHAQQAIAVGFGVVLYGISLSSMAQWLHKSSAGLPDPLVYMISLVLPALAAAILLRSRRVRMASELLRPASRAAYFDGLFQSLAKLMLYSWLAMSLGSVIVLITSQATILQGDPVPLAVGFLLLSLAMQLPAFAIGLRMARWKSTVLFGLGYYGLAIAELGLLVAWVQLQKEMGPIPAAALAAVLLIAAGLPMLSGTRNAWLRAELG